MKSKGIDDEFIALKTVRGGQAKRVDVQQKPKKNKKKNTFV